NTLAPTSTRVPTRVPPPTATAVPASAPPSGGTGQDAGSAAAAASAGGAASPPSAPAGPAYPANPYERFAALRTYHFDIGVSHEGIDYSIVGDETTPNYHVNVSVPPAPAMELYFVNGRYISSLAGSGFVDSGATPPLQAGILEAAEAFARDWFDHPDSATFKGVETVNGVRTNHFVLTWNAGRMVSLGAISATTYDPTTGDVWLDAASGALVKAMFSMRVSAAGTVSEMTTHMDVTSINRPLTITPPPVAANG